MLPPPATPVPEESSAAPARKRVLLVDDHPTFRQGLKLIVMQTGEFEVCGEAADAASAMQQCRGLQPDVVVADVSLPGVSGIELIKMIQAEMPKLPILVVSMHEEKQYALRALKAGAKGYIMKAEAMNAIGAALRLIAAGKLYVSPELAEQLIFKAIESVDEGTGSPVDLLSDRELEVLEKMGRGLTTREIAAYLHLSPKTIESHRAHIKEKLKFKDVTEMVRFAVDWVANPTPPGQPG